jgi:galactose-1-phosphate uridylyltransferase
MIISKSVPMQISRKKFSNFLQATDTANMFFVGYQDATEGKQNI